MNDCSKFYFQYAWREKQYGKWFVMNEVFKKTKWQIGVWVYVLSVCLFKATEYVLVILI